MSEKNITHNIINNLISPVLFSSIRDTLTGDTFYWFYNDFVNYRPCKGYKFTNDNAFIKSTENQLVSFNSDVEYKVVTPTDIKVFTYAVINYD
jgi:hypothetical protein